MYKRQALSINYCLTYPQHSLGLLFTNSMSAFADTQLTERFLTMAAKSTAAIAKSGLAAIEKMPVHPRYAVGLPQDILQPLLERARRLNPAGISRTLAITVPDASVRARIDRNQVPALLLQGVREKRFQPYAEFVTHQMPHTTLARLDAGHGVNMQAKNEFNICVQEFIQTCQRTV